MSEKICFPYAKIAPRLLLFGGNPKNSKKGEAAAAVTGWI
jgi:hypothetical protein